MKKISKIILSIALFTAMNCPLSIVSCQNSMDNSILHRTNIEFNFSTLGSSNFSFGRGLLRYHPERSLNINASMRILQHLEVGAVLSLQGASSTGFSGVSQFSTAPNVDFYYLGWDDNRYHLSGGIMVQLHLNRFDKRFQSFNSVDLILRGGWGLGGQVDGVWIGFGEEFRINKQLLWTLSADYGGFPFATLKQVADNETGWRFCTGLKISLR